MNDNIQTNATGRKLKRVILHDLKHGKQGRTGKNNDKYVLDKLQQDMVEET